MSVFYHADFIVAFLILWSCFHGYFFLFSFWQKWASIHGAVQVPAPRKERSQLSLNCTTKKETKPPRFTFRLTMPLKHKFFVFLQKSPINHRNALDENQKSQQKRRWNHKGHFKTKRVQNPRSVRLYTSNHRRREAGGGAPSVRLPRRRAYCKENSPAVGGASPRSPSQEQKKKKKDLVCVFPSVWSWSDSPNSCSETSIIISRKGKKNVPVFSDVSLLLFFVRSETESFELKTVFRIQSFSSKLSNPAKILRFSSLCVEQSENWGEKTIFEMFKWENLQFSDRNDEFRWVGLVSSDNQLIWLNSAKTCRYLGHF